MYSLFLFTATLSLLLLLRAVERGTRGRWAAWTAATLALLATQPYGVLVLVSEIVYVAALRARRPLPLRAPAIALVAVVVLAGPLWRTYALLASRFEVGVGERSSSSGLPWTSWSTSGTSSVTSPRGRSSSRCRSLSSQRSGSWRSRGRAPESALLAGAIVLVPALALLAAGSGPGVSLETRHLIFVLPFATMAIAAGLLRIGSAAGRAGPGVIAALLGFLLASQIAWGLDRTRWLYTGEPSERAKARIEVADWLAENGRADDVLFGYEPTYLDAWEHGAPFGEIFVPRADAKLALEALDDAGKPLGHGVWVLDASDFVDQDHAQADDPGRFARERVRNRRVRPVPGRQDARADRDLRGLPRGHPEGTRAQRPTRRRRREPQRSHRPRSSRKAGGALARRV